MVQQIFIFSTCNPADLSSIPENMPSDFHVCLGKYMRTRAHTQILEIKNKSPGRQSLLGWWKSLRQLLKAVF